jgi:hypothetical protein
VDYVVFGTGYGATLMLLGWALRTFGPVLRYRQETDAPLRGDMLMARLSWRRFSSALGAVVATSGMALILITFIIIFLNPGDAVGTRIAWACFSLILLAVAVWMWLYVGRFGIYGILPERREPATVFRSETPSRTPARPAGEAPVAAAAPDVVVAHESPGDIEEYEDDYDPWLEDDEYGDEQESRYAKYQLHHPDEEHATQAYEAIVLPDDAEVIAKPVRADSEVERAERAAEPDEPAQDSEPVVISAEPIDAPEETPQPIPAEHADVETDAGTVPEEHTEAPLIEDPSLANEEAEPESDPLQPLSDTPEGRAEALRRIQAWQPEEADGKERS